MTIMNNCLTRFAIFACCLLAAVSGCGPAGEKTYDVSGRVAFDDNTPVRFGVVELRSEDSGLTARGRIELDGTFELGTFTASDGAVAGNHQAIVMQYIPAVNFRPTKQNYHSWQEESERSPYRVTGVVDTRFGDYSTSGLSFTVSPDHENRCELVVTGVPGTPEISLETEADDETESAAVCPHLRAQQEE